jgi:hypothetical protein
MRRALVVLVMVLAPGLAPLAFAQGRDVLVVDGDGVRVVHVDPGLADAVRQVASSVPGLVAEQAAALGIDAPPRVTVSVLSGTPRDADEARRLGVAGMPGWAAGIARGGAAFIAIRVDRLGRYPDRTLTSVLAHEVAHLMLDRALGRDRATEVPAWFDEGYAMTEAARYTGGHRWLLGRSLVFSGPLPLERLERRWPSDGPGARAAYAQVYSFFSYVLDSVGEDAGHAVVRRMGEGARFRMAWREVTGRSPEDWASSWRRSVTFWYRWIPFLTSGTLVWMIAGLLFITAYARRRRLNRQILQRWEEEERFEDPSEDDRFGGPGLA